MESSRDSDLGRSVSTIELFFDLVFVFTVTQLTAVLAEDATAAGLGRVVLMLAAIWWMYGAYSWLTNAVALDRTARRLVLLWGMGAYLVMALAVPRAFDSDGDGLAFGIAYLAVVILHAVLFTRARGKGGRGIRRIAPLNLASAALLLSGCAVGGDTQYVLWSLAVSFAWSIPFIAPNQAFVDVAPAHFVERHGLVVIVAIGESVVGIGMGAAGRPVDITLSALSLLGLALCAGLWWTYFGAGDQRAVAALRDAGARGPRVALVGFGLWHLPVLLGIIAVAFGLEHALAHPDEHAALAPALGLGAGMATFLAGDALFRRTLGVGSPAARALPALLAVGTTPIGTAVGLAAQIVSLVAIAGLAVAMGSWSFPPNARIGPNRAGASPDGYGS